MTLEQQKPLFSTDIDNFIFKCDSGQKLDSYFPGFNSYLQQLES